MPWRKERLTKVELTNPTIRLETNKASFDEVANADPSLAIKLLTFAAVILHGTLAIYGYSVLLGYYDQFGINTSELDLGLPTLLLYGYIYIFSDAMSAANSIPIVGPGFLAFIFIGLAAWFVWNVNRTASTDAKIGLSALFGFILFLAFFVPIWGVTKGQEIANSDLEKNSGIKTKKNLTREHTIISNEGEKLTGFIIIATQQHTFLLRNNIVYKIDSNNNRIIRTTKLKVKSEPTPEN